MSEQIVGVGVHQLVFRVTPLIEVTARWGIGPDSAVSGEDIIVLGLSIIPVAVSTTGWVPQSKPIRFTELGCPAVDRGTNQPNVFYDPKSAESALPYFSRGWQDEAIQRRYIEAMLGYPPPPDRR